jgi:hypothetical protein
LPGKAKYAPFRKADLDNLPLQEARDQCQLCGWVGIRHCETYKDLLPETLTNNPELQKEQRVHLEMIPLCNALNDLAKRFWLLCNGEPPIWVMDTLLENLHQRARRPKAKLSGHWFCAIQVMPETYPARTDEGSTNAATGLPEDELCPIVIKISPKQPNEQIRKFEKRFNDICREERRRYLQSLRAEDWITEPAPAGFKWIDYLARWQAGLSQSEIGPPIKTKTDRTKLSRGIRAAAEYIGITRRESPHGSHHTGAW